MFMLDLLWNLPRLRLSRAHMELILWVMKETGARDVPSIDQLHTMEENLKNKRGGISTRRFKSSIGNVFYVNDIAELVGRVSVTTTR